MLLIYLPQNSSRCKYVFKLIFTEELGIGYQTSNDRNEFQEYSGEKLNYSEERIGEAFFIKASNLLWETKIEKHAIKVVEKETVKVLFPNENDDLGFDVFAAVFFMVSRYEEYLPFDSDEFGRFKAKESLAFQNNFLQKPVVNIWIEIFKEALKNKFEKLQFKASAFKAIITYDIDVAYKFKGRSFGRIMGGTLKDLSKFNLQDFKERIQTFLQLRKDPWDVYDDLQQVISKNELSSNFFFYWQIHQRMTGTFIIKIRK